MRFRNLMAAFATAVLIGGLPCGSRADDKPAGKAGPPAGFPDLVGALKATPGCLGVETARTQSGKQVIFAWFEDKKAVLRWYHSEPHQRVMKLVFPDRQYSKPLKDVPDGTGPIMAVASLTPAPGGPTKERPLPFSQIAIELYQPLSGGIYIGGRFAPEGMKISKTHEAKPREK